MSMIAKNNEATPNRIAKSFAEEQDELVFVVMDGPEAGKVAIEGRCGMVAFAEDVSDLKKEIVNKVQEHFKGKFRGKICVRQFVDEHIRL